LLRVRQRLNAAKRLKDYTWHQFLGWLGWPGWPGGFGNPHWQQFLANVTCCDYVINCDYTGAMLMMMPFF